MRFLQVWHGVKNFKNALSNFQRATFVIVYLQGPWAVAFCLSVWQKRLVGGGLAKTAKNETLSPGMSLSSRQLPLFTNPLLIVSGCSAYGAWSSSLSFSPFPPSSSAIALPGSSDSLPPDRGGMVAASSCCSSTSSQVLQSPRPGFWVGAQAHKNLDSETREKTPLPGLGLKNTSWVSR